MEPSHIRPLGDLGADPRGNPVGAPILLTVEQCAKHLQLSRSHTYKFVLSGALPSVTLGRTRRIPVRALEEFVQRLLRDQEYPADSDGGLL